MCGSTDLERQNAKGSFWPYLDYEQVELKNDLMLLTCNQCNNRVVSSKDIIELDSLLVKSLLSENKPI